MIIEKSEQMEQQFIFVANSESEEEAKKLESVASKLISTFGEEFFSDFNLDLIVEKLTEDLGVTI